MNVIARRALAFLIGLVLAFIAAALMSCGMSCPPCPLPAQSWDQETLSKESNLMTCPDHNYVFGTVNGQLKECL
jgi:hypothetical protein